MITSKTDALQKIICFDAERDAAIDYLVSNPEVSDSPAVAATKPMLALVLKKYISDEISVDDLEEWAGFIEFCDDIDAAAIEDYLYALSNPELMGEISKEKAQQMIDLLEGC